MMQAALSTTSSLLLARAMLARTAPFSELPGAVLDALVAAGRLHTWAADEAVHQEGDALTEVELLLSGWLASCMRVPDGRSLILGLCGPGTLLGLTAVVGVDDPSRCQVAREPAQTLHLPLARVRELHAGYPAFAARTATILARRLHAVHDEMAEAVALPARTRLARRLLRKAARWGLWRDGALELPMRLSQADLAQMLGLSRQQVNLEMRGFVKAGWVEVRREQVRLTDPDGLLAAFGPALPGAAPIVLPVRPDAVPVPDPDLAH
jgi:CRP-like cAMP-binding protein